MIKPSIGRVVLVFRGSKAPIQPKKLPRAADAPDVYEPAQAEPALVTYVHDDRTVNVAGFAHDGDHFRVHNIQLLQDDDKPLRSPHAEWMEYQKAQAAKATP